MSEKDNGVYGRKKTFADACVTVTEFLDDLYDEHGNYNQAFLSLERRLQEYFEYQPRDTENGDAEPDQGDVEFVVYNDGLEWGRYANEADAAVAVRAYTGDHSVWYERVPVDADYADLGKRKAKAHYMAAIRCLYPNMRESSLAGVEAKFDTFCNDIKNAIGGA